MHIFLYLHMIEIMFIIFTPQRNLNDNCAKKTSAICMLKLQINCLQYQHAICMIELHSNCAQICYAIKVNNKVI